MFQSGQLFCFHVRWKSLTPCDLSAFKVWKWAGHGGERGGADTQPALGIIPGGEEEHAACIDIKRKKKEKREGIEESRPAVKNSSLP